MTPVDEPSERWLSLTLSFVGGYADAASFVLANTFTGHVTGNLVLTAASIASRDWRTTFARLLAVVMFLAGVVLSVALARFLAARQSPPLLPIVFAVEVILVIAGWFALESHVPMRREIFVLCLSLALGFQNGTIRRAGAISIHTTYLTGMITSLLVTEAENFLPWTAGRAPAPLHARRTLLYGIWACFFLGATTGATLVFHFKAAGMLGIVAILVALAAANLIAARPTRSTN